MRVFGILFVILLAGCAGKSELDTWQGAAYDDLLLTYGPPSNTARLDDGRRLVEFSYSKSVGVVGTGGNVVGGGEHQCKVWFLLDQQGRVVESRHKGNIGGCNNLIQARN